ncbi:MAG: hypothetical protein ABSF60_07670, partial [Verrucomicrobiota bacterium]
MYKNENNFESLRRLLALKRYETPPPGYYHHFSSQVLQRIRAGDTGTSAGWAEDLFGQAPWLEKLLHAFDVKPVFASAFAGALCLLLLLGIIYAERPDFTPQPILQTAAASPTAVSTPTTSLAAVSPTVLSEPADQQPGIVTSTSPVLSLQPVAPPFE